VKNEKQCQQAFDTIMHNLMHEDLSEPQQIVFDAMLTTMAWVLDRPPIGVPNALQDLINGRPLFKET
jgi:hypothetical protein